MAAQELQLKGTSLGDKHRAYNEILQGQIITQQMNRDLIEEDGDINNLLKIDLANYNRDVEFILKALQSDDLLYVSRALARCTWLITDQNYADIINPNYLQTYLFPKMTTKAMIKLKKHIRHNIKDETRSEMFYLNEKYKTEAIKWLPHCSVPFIKNNIKNHNIKSYKNPMKLKLFKRLCERSIAILEIIIEELSYHKKQEYLQVVTFFLNTDIDNYLNLIENIGSSSDLPKFNRKATNLIMKHSPNRVIDKIDMYISIIHIPTFVKYLKVDEIKPFLYCQAKKDDKIFDHTDLTYLLCFDNLQYFIKKLPKEEQFDFVKEACMIKEGTEVLKMESDASYLRIRCSLVNRDSFIWYQFAPFDLAFKEIKTFMTHATTIPEERRLLSLLVKYSGDNFEQIQVVLRYFINNHKNEDTFYKIHFITSILEHLNIAKCDENTWKLINDILTSTKIYKTSSNLTQDETEIVNCIIIYNALNDRSIPEVIIKRFLFCNLKSYRVCMNQEQQNKVFNCLCKYLSSQIKPFITNEDEFRNAINNLKKILILLKDWEKSLLEYPAILNKIKEIIRLKKTNSWEGCLVCLYTVNKSWRKHMFEESLALCPNEEVCLNALKHDPHLLERHGDEVDTLRTHSKVLMCRLLHKLRVYWTNTLAQQWIDAYFEIIKKTNSLDTVVRSLCIMLPQKQLRDVIEKYKPKSSHINWKEMNESVVNMQRYLAKNMYRCRPQLTPDAILPYAVGDYLQFALPSLIAVFYNLKSPVMEQYIPYLLNAPVSLQKHGIRIAFEKFNHKQLMEIFLKCWNLSRNLSIRAIIFKYTFTLLCSEKDPINAISLWEFLKQLIDQLSYAENNDIYKMLSEVNKVPFNVRAQFLKNSYEFLKTLITKIEETDRWEYQAACAKLATYSRKLMETIDPGFITEIIDEFIEKDFFKTGDGNSNLDFDGMIGVISAYILYSQNEEEQIQKYKKILEPLLRRSFTNWNNICEGKYYIRQHFQELLNRLSYDLKDYVIKKELVIPYFLYLLIQIELQNALSIPDNYLLLTNWKLTVALAKLLNQYAPIEHNEDWDEMIAHKFGTICLEFLKKDVSVHFPCIYVLFSKSLTFILRHMMSRPATKDVYNAIMCDPDFIQGYLAVIEIEGHNYRTKDKTLKSILEHPSIEVKMHCYRKLTLDV